MPASELMSNAPPLHPHCRSVIVGSLKGNSRAKGQRAARDEKGKYIRVPADMTYKEWYNKYIEPTIVPTGEGEWKTDASGQIIITKQIPQGTHFSTPARAEPNAVIMHYGVKNQHDYDLYDTRGYAALQIHCGPHGNLKKHPFPEHGEHASVWSWILKDGKWKRIHGKNRALTKQERLWVHDDLTT